MPNRIQATIKEQGPLTPCETNVLKYLCEGYMRKEIAARVFRSYGCVSKQIESIAEKLDAHSAAEIVSVAVAMGLVEISIKQDVQRQALIKCLIAAMLLNPAHMDLRQPPRPARQATKFVRTTRTENTTRSQP